MSFYSIRKLFGLPAKTPNRTRVRANVKMTLESLETRWVPATLVVNPGQSIQAAVNMAHAGDTVLVKPGTYVEQVVVNKSIDLEGYGASSIIQAPGNLGAPTAANPGAIVRVTGANVRAEIEGFTIRGAAAAGTPNLLYGVRVDGNAFAEIEWNHITNIIDSSDGQLGVAIDVGHTPSLSHDDFTGDQVGTAEIESNVIDRYQRAGIVINHAGSFGEIEGNSVTGLGTATNTQQIGVEVSDGAVAEVEENAISANGNSNGGAGVLLFNPGAIASGCGFQVTEVSGNCITNNDYGVFGTAATTLAGQTTSAYIDGNSITNSVFVGVEIDNSSGVRIYGNYLAHNGGDLSADGGIYLFNSTGNTISGNLSIRNDGSGIFIDATSTGNVISCNTFKYNDYDPSAAVMNADAVDLSVGTGTAGTGNTWSNNQGGTFITVSGQSLFRRKARRFGDD